MFYPKWRCNGCGREVFNNEYFCSKCESELPYISENFCEHCGRQLKNKAHFCLSCKDYLTELEVCRSVFNYDKPISTLIKKLKYENGLYLAKMFSEYLAKAYNKYQMTADYLTFVPMTLKAERKRGYNQSRLLCEQMAKILQIQVFYGITKEKETKRQARLSKQARLRNLLFAFKINDKKSVINKRILVIDDVTTTGSTAKVLAQKFIKAGARSVSLLTIASVAHKEGY